MSQMAKGGDGSGKHRQIGIKADDFGKCHEAAGSRAAKNEILIGELRLTQLIYACVILQADEMKARIQ